MGADIGDGTVASGALTSTDAAGLSEAKRRLLGAYLRGDARLRSAAARPAARRPAGADAPLSHGQQLIWLHSQIAPDLPVYNEPITVHRRGPLDVAALERSLSEILRRHEAWRTTFETRGGQPVQVVQPPPPVTLPVVDLRDLPAEAREREALRLATEDARCPFSLSQGPLLRGKLFRLADDEHRLHLTLHHIIFDGVSTYRVFLPELTAVYEAFANGRPSPLPELPCQYGDYAYAQRRIRSEHLGPQLAYWRRQLRELPELELPTDRPRPPVQSFRGGMHPLALPADLSEALRELSRREGVTLFMTLLAAFQTLLHRYTGQDDLVVGTVSAGRKEPEAQGLLGFFLNVLLLRTDLSGTPSFREVLRRVREVTVLALANEDVPYETLVKELKPRRDPSRNPLYQVLFSLEPQMPALPPGWSLTQTDVETGTAKLDLYLELDDRPTGIVGRFMFNTDIFERATIERMAGHWLTLLAGIARDPGRAISRLPVLTEGERRHLRTRSNRLGPRQGFVRFGREETEQTIGRRFEAIAAAHPTRTAVTTPGRTLTYGLLNRRANQIGRSLLEQRGEGEETLALLLGPEDSSAAMLLAALKAGKSYLPLDPHYPRERLSQVLRDARARALVTSRAHLALAHEVAAGDLPVIDVDEVAASGPGENLAPRGRPDSLAYLLYTSGSTGRPKGVMQSHANVLRFIAAYTNELHLNPEDRLTLVSSYGFDASVMDVFGALLNGATLCPADVRTEGVEGLAERLSSLEVTVYHSTPTVFRHLAAGLQPGDQFRRVRLVVLGGEEVRRTDFDLHRRHFPNALFVNLSGQTESSLNLLCFLDRASQVSRTTVPMGYPVADTEVLLLDEQGQPTELFGEIGVRSPQVALGYWGQAELTRRAFVPGPDGGARRLYRTGDRALQLRDGSLLFMGRRDLQVKVRGVRIELPEVEAALGQHPALKEAAAAVWDMGGGDKRLVAYCVPRQAGAKPIADEVRRFLRATLPEAMVPSTFLFPDALPQTPSGKLDRRALSVPDLHAPAPDAAAVAPRDGVEGRLLGIWKGVLGVETAGVLDDFFDLGGHSLLAVRLFGEIERTFGHRIPLGTLLGAPTVEKLAAVLRAKGGAAPWSSLVPLQPAGERPPFFGVHGHSGEVLFYRDLCRHLGRDQPFYALQARGLSGRDAHRSIEAMAAHYLEEVRSVQPRGPYLIGGYCFGAYVAFEMAQRLRAAGEEVALLALFVGYAARPGRMAAAGRAGSFLERALFHLGELQERPPAERTRYLLRKSRDAARAAAEAARTAAWRAAHAVLPGRVDLPWWLLRNVGEVNRQAARAYAPRPYPGRMTVFLGGEPASGFSLDPVRDLDGLAAREVEVRLVPGTTATMLQEPHVAVLAAELKACLEAGAPRETVPGP